MNKIRSWFINILADAIKEALAERIVQPHISVHQSTDSQTPIRVLINDCVLKATEDMPCVSINPSK